MIYVRDDSKSYLNNSLRFTELKHLYKVCTYSSKLWDDNLEGIGVLYIVDNNNPCSVN